MDPLSALERSPNFAPADHSTLERLAAQMVPRDYPAATVIFSEGDPPGPAYLVQSGWVRMTSARPNGGSQLLTKIGPGELAGDMTALLDRPRAATATTVEPVSAWGIPADALQTAFRDDPRLAYAMMLTVMELFVDRELQALRRLGLPPVRQLATILLNQQRAEQVEEGQPLSIRSADLQLMTGESATVCVMNLARLRRAGAVETRGERGEHLVITNLERLRRLAE